MKWLIGIIVAVLIVALIGVGGYVAYQQGWIYPPTIMVDVTTQGEDGRRLAGAAVTVGGQKAETDANGELAVPLKDSAPGTELTVNATLERPGMRFRPYEGKVVVKKWERGKPDTLRQPLPITLVAEEISAELAVESNGAGLAGVDVSLDGKTLGKTDGSGVLKVDLTPDVSRTAKVTVKASGYEPVDQEAIFEAGRRVTLSLAKLGANSSVRAVYASMGRLVGVPGAEVTIGGKSAGRTDNAGTLKVTAPEKDAKVEVRKEGFLPSPGTGKLPAGKPGEALVVLVPQSAPAYRIALLPPTTAVMKEPDVVERLPEIQERLTDALFSHEVFERVDPDAFQKAMASSKLNLEKLAAKGWEGTPARNLADAAVIVVASKAEGELLVSVRMVGANGKQIAGVAETGKMSKIKSLCEAAADKILEAFPFEGHVLEVSDDKLVTSLGTAGDRTVKRGAMVGVQRLAPGKPPKVTDLGKVKVAAVRPDGSDLAVPSNKAQVGDTVMIIPPETAATLDSAVVFSVKAGREGSEKPMSDVTVYRNGTWVGTTSATGEIKVPVNTGQKVTFIFVKGGIPAHVESLKIEKGQDRAHVLMPATMARLTMESEPSGAQVSIDGEPVGSTPLETDVLLGFHRVVVDAGEGWRSFDKVLEFSSLEESLTGAKKIALQRDLLRQSEELLAKGQVDQAISILAGVAKDHPDYSQAHHRLAGIYLDEKKDATRAISEYELVLDLPENRELVNKRFAVSFLNLGRAYYLDKQFEKAVGKLVTARDNKRFFPRDHHEQATHDTLYYLALSTQKLYHAQRSDKYLRESAARWKDYFDFFPPVLQDEEEVKAARASAQQYYEEIERKLKED